MQLFLQRLIVIVLIILFPPLLLIPVFRVEIPVPMFGGKSIYLWNLVLLLQLGFLIALIVYAVFGSIILNHASKLL
jgi:hypothetical protein